MAVFARLCVAEAECIASSVGVIQQRSIDLKTEHQMSAISCALPAPRQQMQMADLFATSRMIAAPAKTGFELHSRDQYP
jgi:hypothetical protein